MQISNIRNLSSNRNFGNYEITENGKESIYRIQDSVEKKNYIDLCKSFENKDYAHIKIDGDGYNKPKIYIKIPDVPHYMDANEYNIPTLTHDSQKLWIRTQGRDYFINFHNKSARAVGQLSDSLRPYKPGLSIFQKMELFGDEIENLYKDREKSKALNSDVDELFLNQKA